MVIDKSQLYNEDLNSVRCSNTKVSIQREQLGYLRVFFLELEVGMGRKDERNDQHTKVHGLLWFLLET